MAEYTLEQQQAIALANARARLAQQQTAPEVDTNPVPTKENLTSIAPADNSKIVEFLSGGKAGNLEQWMYGGETPEQSTLGKMGQLIRQSGVEGLQGIAPVGQLESAVTAIGSNIPTAANVATKIAEKAPAVAQAGQKVASGASRAAQYIKEMPSRFLSFESKVPTANIKAAYQIGREQNPAVVQGFKEVLEKPPLSPEYIGQYNYSRKFGLPPDWASKATRMGYEDENATWNLLDKYLKEGNKTFPLLDNATEFAKLPKDVQLQYLKDLGVSFGSIKPTTKGGQLAGGLEGAAAAAEASHLFPLLSKSVVGAKALPLLPFLVASKSPYIVGRAAYGAGKAANVAGKLSPLFTTELPVNQTLATLGLLGN